MHEPIEEAYLNWLCATVMENPERPDFRELLHILQSYEFVPLLTGDHNRAEEGLAVRQQFLNETGLDANPEWNHIACSVLEMLIGLAIRAAWQTVTPPREWFWVFMQNLKLEDYRRIDPEDVPDVEEKLYMLVWRTYDDNGNGGIFPLRRTPYDQRMVEIWYQFSEYMDENDLV